MDKKERVIAAIHKAEVDHVPCGFSLHFPKGENTAETHIKFFRETKTDIGKIMNENLVFSEEKIVTAEGFSKIPSITRSTPFLENQIQITRKIVQESDKDLFLLGTLHGICASSVHPLEQRGMDYMEARKFVIQCLRENPAPVLAAFERITEGMCELAKAYIEEGVDGIYYAALGGERDLLTDEEFAKWFKPYDMRIMECIKESGGYCFLHICKDGLNMNRYRGYDKLADVVNWGIYEVPFSLKEGRTLFPDCAVMGGLPNRSGVMTEGTKEELEQEVKRLVQEFGRRGFILGADCTLPTEIPYERIRWIAEEVHKI